ncbi:MAG: hypothetical protein ACI84D_003904, partial [Thalassolituus oleivorans]
MANSFYPLTPETAVEVFPSQEVLDPVRGFIYRVVREGDRFFQDEILRDGGGKEGHRLRREMKYVMGSGTAARTYFDDSQGYLHELPITWYTQEGRWDFSPGYRKANKRFDRTVPERCMACHNSYPVSAPHADGKYLEIPQGIGCERCHGPGALHVSARLAVPEPPTAVDSTIVNPAHLDLGRRLDVCQQCHLHTTVSILRDGNGAFDFRPSHDLGDYLALFAVPESASDSEVGVISHADRMTQSACFIATIAQGGSFECTTCHNPHEGFRASGPAYFNETCQTCHAPATLTEMAAHTPSANCIDCHMPRVEAAEAPHSSFTDHRVRVVSSREAAAGPSVGGDLQAYFQDPRDVPGSVYEGMAYVILGRQRGQADLSLKGAHILDSLAGTSGIHGEAEFLRGLARLEAGEVSAALPGLRAAALADGDVPERLNALAQAYEFTGAGAPVIEDLYRRAVAVQPARADIWVNYGRFLESQGRMEDAVSAYERAVEQQPWLPEASYNLGTALTRIGRLAEGIARLRDAGRL